MQISAVANVVAKEEVVQPKSAWPCIQDRIPFPLNRCVPFFTRKHYGAISSVVYNLHIINCNDPPPPMQLQIPDRWDKLQAYKWHTYILENLLGKRARFVTKATICPSSESFPLIIRT